MNLKDTQAQVDASFLYNRLAEEERDKYASGIFRQMSDIMHEQAQKNNKKKHMPKPSWRAKTLDRIGKIFGYDQVFGILMDDGKSVSNKFFWGRRRSRLDYNGGAKTHEEILKQLIQKESELREATLLKIGDRPRTIRGNALRAAVLGGNDGLVSNFGLVMGVAGANADRGHVLLAGVAGLLAGALSMALGEWISVKSSQELYENQMNLEMKKIKANPGKEREALASIYMSKGIPQKQAEDAAEKVIQDKQHAHEILVKETLGINPDELEGSAMEAALASFFLFAFGAIVPVLPFIFDEGITAIIWSGSLSALALFGIGAAITLFTGRNVWISGIRQMMFGLVTAVITFAIGRLLGVSIAA